MITFCEAIARQEGWYFIRSRCRRNRNPGNIEYGPFSISHGATATDGRFAIFPTDQLGFNCMSALLAAKYKGLTVAAAIAKWAPPSENDTTKYIADVCAWTQLASTDLLSDAILAPPQIQE